MTWLGVAAFAMLGAASAGGAAPIAVSDIWSRPTPPGTSVGVVYLRLRNPAATADRLLRLRSPVAAAVELHETRMDNGLMSMRRVPFLDLPAGGDVAVVPGGLHIMLLGLKAPLIAGARFPLTLVFAHGGELSVNVDVRSAM